VPTHNVNARKALTASLVINLRAIPTKQASSYSQFLKGGLTNYPYRQTIFEHSLIRGVAKCVYLRSYAITSRLVRFCPVIRGLAKQTFGWSATKQSRQGSCLGYDGELLLKWSSRIWQYLIKAKRIFCVSKIQTQQYGLFFSFRHSNIQGKSILSSPEPLFVDNPARGPPRRM
jgi:hypothetical protein